MYGCTDNGGIIEVIRSLFHRVSWIYKKLLSTFCIDQIPTGAKYNDPRILTGAVEHKPTSSTYMAVATGTGLVEANISRIEYSYDRF